MVGQGHAADEVLVLWCYAYDLLMKQFTLLAHEAVIDLAKHEISSKIFPNFLHQVVKYNVFFFVSFCAVAIRSLLFLNLHHPLFSTLTAQMIAKVMVYNCMVTMLEDIVSFTLVLLLPKIKIPL